MALGSGLLKTAAITILGAAFPTSAGPPFQIFYLGINIGAFLGPMLTGWLAEARGFHVGFGAAALLMVVGCVNYLALRGRMLGSLSAKSREFITQPANPAEPQTQLKVLIASVLVIVAAVWGLRNPDRLAYVLLIATVATALGSLSPCSPRHG